MTSPTRDVFQLELEKRGVVQAVTNDVTGGIDLIGPGGEAITQEDLGWSASEIDSTGVMSVRFGTGATSTALTAGYSSVEQKPVGVDPFYGVRLMFINYGASAYTVDAAKVACVPTDLHNGAGQTFTAITVGGAAQFTVPAMTQGAGGTAGNNRIPGIAYSDFIPLKSVERTDVPGAPYLLQIRAFGSGVINTTSGPISRTNSSKPYLADKGYVFGWQQATSDVVTTISNVTPGNSSALGVVGHIEAYTGKTAHRMFAFGDSLTAGYSGTADSGQCGWPNIVTAAMHDAGLIGGVSNYAVGGMTQANFIATMKTVCAAVKPSSAYLPSMSPNTSYTTQANWDAQYAATLEAVDWLRSRGIQPIVSTAMAINTNSEAVDGFRKAFNARLIADLSSVATIWDFAGVVDDPATNPTDMIAAYSYDSVHQNTAGQQAIADYISAQLGL